MNNKYSINHRKYTKDEIIILAESQSKRLDTPEWERDLYAFITDWFSPTEYMAIHTSGSTGIPKEILISKTKMIGSAARTLRYFDVKPNENILLCLPVTYIAGMMMVVRAFTGSLNLITLPPQQMQLSNIKEELGFAAFVPLQMDKLLNEGQNLGFMRKIILGGSPVSAVLEDKIRTSFTGQIWETYGMTETITHVAVRKIKDDVRIFFALPGISFSEDDRGCLVIDDPYLLDSPLHTNDNVELLSPTSFRLLGRMDHVINSGGIKVIPEKLESLMSPYVQGHFCITSLPDEVLGEMIVLVVEKGTDMLRIMQGIDTLKTYHKPKKVFELDQIPINQHGKIDVREVKQIINKLV